MVRTTRRRSAGGRFVASGTSPRTTSLRAPIVTPPFHERSRSEELQPTDVEDRPVRATSYREEKKEAKMEIKNTGLKANPWKVTKDGPTISGHLARIERMLRHTAIDPKTATAYFVLYYSVSDNVKDVLQDRDLTLLPEASLYEQLRKELLTLYYDAGDNSRLRKSLNTIVHRSDMSLAAFFEEVESIVARLRLQGSVVTEDELYDLYCATLRPPYSDWILTYRLDSVPYERARLLMLSRSRSHESHMLAPTPSTFTQLQQLDILQSTVRAQHQQNMISDACAVDEEGTDEKPAGY
ncbi:hypothetical protein FOL47_001545 [Perkinsus chesapeaki]|uniref:Uncharacterized protein n=1 Tax=Perkinsus chesapeaki TaxID=330153 RepID=A0A7J6KTZ9_PERCH|nr:hypothetical protein FOL47_001545 [Perkinsus chesapeaki]